MFPRQRKPQEVSDRVAMLMALALDHFADAVFGKRYGHRAVVLETIAALPGFIAGFLVHLRCLRMIRGDYSWVYTTIHEAENEYAHLLIFKEVVGKARWWEALMMKAGQVGFGLGYALMYLLSPKVSHRFTGYLEMYAIDSYTTYLDLLSSGEVPNPPAPRAAREYYGSRLPENATLKDVVMVIRDDECHHYDTNHEFANRLKEKAAPGTPFETVDKLPEDNG
jgi:ubiquinol oxidase